MVELGQITPCMDVPDLAAAIAFFEDKLGFAVRAREKGYAYVERGGAAFRLFEAPNNGPLRPGDGRFGAYVCLDTVDALHAELAPRFQGAEAADLCGPQDKVYGMREVSVLAPDGNRIVFGQRLW